MGATGLVFKQHLLEFASKKCEKVRKSEICCVVVWSGNRQNVRGSHFAVPSFQDLKYLRHSQRVKADRNHYSHPLDLHPQQKQSIQLISRPIGKRSTQKMRLDYLWTGCDSRQNKTRSA